MDKEKIKELFKLDKISKEKKIDRLIEELKAVNSQLFAAIDFIAEKGLETDFINWSSSN